MKCYKDKFKTSLHLRGMDFTIWDMVADGFWATKRLLMLLTSVNKTGQAPQDAKGSRAMSK